MGCPGCGASLFGASSQYIKTNAGDIIAVDGANIREKLILSDMRIPYKQILKSRVILKPGQVDYLLNHLGMGDNATFLSIRAMYDSKSTLEANNYVNWSYYDDISSINTFGQFMVLTGNSTHRIKQIYLTNPNVSYPVYLDVMIAVIDDNYSFFNDIINQNATTFTGLEYTDIQSYVIGQSIVIYDKNIPQNALTYFTIADISSMERQGDILTIEDSLKVVLLKFLTEYDAAQALSILNKVTEDPSIDISTLTSDDVDPIMYFFSNVGGISGTGSYISFNGATAGVPYDTSSGLTFSADIDLSIYGTTGSIDKQSLIDLTISNIYDQRDGTMSIIPGNLILTDQLVQTVNTISTTGSYALSFDFSDIAQNYLDGVILNLNII